MRLMGNLVRSFMSPQAPPDTVQQVNIAAYINVPVIAREEALILYGPTRQNNYELLLEQPIGVNSSTAFSLFRLTNQQSAQERFILLREVLVPLLCPADAPATVDLHNARALQELLNLQRDHPTWTAAHLAASMDRPDLLQLPAIARYSNTAELELRLTPLHIAVERQQLACVKALLAQDVSLDAVDVKGNSVYHVAASTTRQIIVMLTELAPHSTLLNIPNMAGNSPLHLACQADKPDCVTALLAAGADVNIAASTDSSLAIHTAMAADSATCAKEILARHPNMLHSQDMKFGGTPLHWAKSKNMINSLVELQCSINARNFIGRSALHLMTAHDRLDCVLALLSHGASSHLADDAGNTALHEVKGLAVLQALVLFGAPLDVENAVGETPRHRICTSAQKPELLYALHAVGARRCRQHLASCSAGCSPMGSFDGVPPQALADASARQRSSYDAFLDDAMGGLRQQMQQRHQDVGFSGPSLAPKSGRLLCLDGGGIRGLVLIVLLQAVQRQAGAAPITQLFDWISGTSTGAILALALAMGRTPEYTLRLYFKLKDAVFQGSRPYAEGPLEVVLKQEFGETTRMSDITKVKVVVTGVLADRFPADLHLFRNYIGGEELLKQGMPAAMLQSPGGSSSSGGSSSGGRFVPIKSPSQQLVWEAARASGAAPSYFRAYGRFIDGGLIANNPSLDLLTEISERNTVLAALSRQDDVVRPAVLLSLGTGRPPLEQVNAIDFFRPESLYGSLQMAFGLSNMAKLLVDQATMADNHTVDRCRAWCRTCGVRYTRLSPQLSADVQLDETKDDVLLNMLWETMVYCHSNKDQIQGLATALR